MDTHRTGSASVLGLTWLIHRPRLSRPDCTCPTSGDRGSRSSRAGPRRRVQLDQYALASAMQSEEKTDKGAGCGTGDLECRQQDRSKIVGKLLPHGYFSSQESGQYAATHKPPTARPWRCCRHHRGKGAEHGPRRRPVGRPETRIACTASTSRIQETPPHKHSSTEIAQRRMSDGAHESGCPGARDPFLVLRSLKGTRTWD